MTLPGRAAALPLLAVALQAGVASAWGWFSACCGNPLGGTCADGSAGNPCCGKGGCNAMCCGCSDGCRERKPEVGHLPITAEMRRVPLNQWPMLQAHDAGSSYAESDTCTVHNQVNSWAVTQSRGGFRHLLGCGARAIDLRPYVKGDGHLVMHHGSILFNTPVSEALEDVISWANDHDGTFILIVMGHCTGEGEHATDACVSKTNRVITRAGIASLRCEDIAGTTLGEAMRRGAQPKGGSVLATWAGCVDFNWDADIKCYGAAMQAASQAVDGLQNQEELGPDLASVLDFASREQPHNGSAVEGALRRQLPADHRRLFMAEMSCYGSEHDRQQAFRPLWNYMDKLCNTAKPPHENKDWLWVAQAHWQYDGASIAEGTARGSCILKDSQRSDINKQVADKIRAGQYKHLNIVEVDHICYKGEELTTAIHEFILNKLAKPQGKFETLAEPVVVERLARGRSVMLWAGPLLLVLGGFASGATVLLRRRLHRRTCQGHHPDGAGTVEGSASERLVECCSSAAS